MSKIIRSNSSGKKAAVVFIIIAILIICLAFFGIAYASANSTRSLKGITINNAKDVGDQTVEQINESIIVTILIYKNFIRLSHVSWSIEVIDAKILSISLNSSAVSLKQSL